MANADSPLVTQFTFEATAELAKMIRDQTQVGYDAGSTIEALLVELERAGVLGVAALARVRASADSPAPDSL